MAGGGGVGGEDRAACRGGAAALPTEVDVVSYFLSRREADADSTRFLAAVVPQLAYLLEEDPPAAELHQFRALWQRAAERAAAPAGTCCWSSTGWMRTCGRPGCRASRRCCRRGGRPRARAGDQPPASGAAASTCRPGIRWGPPEPVVVLSRSRARELADLARQEIDELTHRAMPDSPWTCWGCSPPLPGRWRSRTWRP